MQANLIRDWGSSPEWKIPLPGVKKLNPVDQTYNYPCPRKQPIGDDPDKINTSWVVGELFIRYRSPKESMMAKTTAPFLLMVLFILAGGLACNLPGLRQPEAAGPGYI